MLVGFSSLLIGLDEFFQLEPHGGNRDCAISGSAEKLGEDKRNHQGKTGPGEERG